MVLGCAVNIFLPWISIKNQKPEISSQIKTELDHMASSKVLPGCWVLEFSVLFYHIQIMFFTS